MQVRGEIRKRDRYCRLAIALEAPQVKGEVVPRVQWQRTNSSTRDLAIPGLHADSNDVTIRSRVGPKLATTRRPTRQARSPPRRGRNSRRETAKPGPVQVITLTGQPRDLLDGHAVRRHQRYEGVPEIPRRPSNPEPSGLRESPELPPDVGRIQRGADSRDEHEPVILPHGTSRQPVLGLPPVVLP